MYLGTHIVCTYVSTYHIWSAIVNLSGIRLSASLKSLGMTRSMHYESWEYFTIAKPCCMIKHFHPNPELVHYGQGRVRIQQTNFKMNCMLVKHRPSLFSTALHVCACTVSFQCSKVCVFWCRAHSWIFKIHVSDLHACHFGHIWSSSNRQTDFDIWSESVMKALQH